MALGTETEVKEAILVSNEIQTLASLLLSSDEIEMISQITPMFLLSEDAREEAQQRAFILAPMRPKRPIYYAITSLTRLPDEARHSMKFFGDYIDMLVKSLTKLVTRDDRSSFRSLGSNLLILNRILNLKVSFFEVLKLYNEAIYVPAKHHFDLPDDRLTHRFSTKEALMTALISMHLAELISIEYGVQLAKNLQSFNQISVSLIMVDAESRVLLGNESESSYDVPFKISFFNARPSDLAYVMSEELTTGRGIIMKCQGPYDRVVKDILFKEIVFVIYSPSAKAITAGNLQWHDPLSIPSSSYLKTAKNELDAFL